MSYYSAHSNMQTPNDANNALMNKFREVDSDKNGHITCYELNRALFDLGYKMFNEETCRLMMNMFDFDHSGTITYNEFCSLWNYINEWNRTFQGFDLDRSGTIDCNELSRALLSFGYNIPPNLINSIVKKYDRHGRGSVTFDSFIQCCTTIKYLTDAFRRYDVEGKGWITLGYHDFLGLVMSNQ